MLFLLSEDLSRIECSSVPLILFYIQIMLRCSANIDKYVICLFVRCQDFLADQPGPGLSVVGHFCAGLRGPNPLRGHHARAQGQPGHPRGQGGERGPVHLSAYTGTLWRQSQVSGVVKGTHTSWFVLPTFMFEKAKMRILYFANLVSKLVIMVSLAR